MTETRDLQLALAFIRALVEEDGEGFCSLLQEEITGDTFVAVVQVAASVMTQTYGEDHSLQLIEGWQNQALAEATP